MKRVHKYGLEVVPTFEQAAGLKQAVQKPPALYKSWEEWNGFPLSNMRAQGEEIETQEELVLRKAQMEQVLTRIAHEHQMPREAVRGTLRTMAGSMGSGVVNAFLRRFRVADQPAQEQGRLPRPPPPGGASMDAARPFDADWEPPPSSPATARWRRPSGRRGGEPALRTCSSPRPRPCPSGSSMRRRRSGRPSWSGPCRCRPSRWASRWSSGAAARGCSSRSPMTWRR